MFSKKLWLYVKNKLVVPLLGDYKLYYRVSFLRYFFSKLFQRTAIEKYDLVFIVFDESRGWILEGICKEIATYFPGKYCFHYSVTSLPPSKAYFFAHYGFFRACLRSNPHLWSSKSFVFYTHPKGIMANEEFVYVMNRSTKVISMSSQFARRMVECGVSPAKVSFIIGGGADPEIFQPHQRSNGSIGFCTAYYARKDPDHILKVIKLLPHRRFILLGRNWNQYEKFTEMTALPNLSYMETPYSDYPRYYAEMDVFVSPAKLEGGPIPLIEAMMCNVVPVASKTGFAPDIITDGENGFLFEVDSPAELICDLIEKAFLLKTNVRSSVEHLSWKRFSLEIQELLKSS